MRLLRLLSLTGMALVMTCTLAAQSAAVTSRIAGKIDETQRTTLRGAVHPLANAANDRGAVPDEMPVSRVHLMLKRSESQETALRQLIAEMHTPGTANYHKWLTPEAFGKQFGPSDEDVAKVTNWLSSHGFSVTAVNPGKQTIEFSGTAGQMRSAFGTQIHKYAVQGETHFSTANDPQIPAALAPVVGGFVTLNNFRAKSHLRALGKASYDPKTDRAVPAWTEGTNNFALSPGDYAVQYDLKPLYTAGINGSGQTIAIINESNINVARANLFRSLFGLPYNPPQVIVDGNDPGIDGVNNPDGPNYASVEAYLDVEWAGAVAPQATVDLVIGADTELSHGLELAAEHAVYSNIAPIMSVSFGYCENGLGNENVFLNSLWEQAAAQGITVLVSSGDNGSAGCDDDNTQDFATGGQAVSGWASTPYNVAVGGTDFYYSSYQNSSALASQLSTYWNTTSSPTTPTVSLLQAIPEQPWNDSQFGLNVNNYFTLNNDTSIAAGSGGASNCALATYDSSGNTASCTGGYPKPAWQSAAGVPSDGVRDIPDVSLFAANGQNNSYYPICAIDGDCEPAASGGSINIYGVGGTSASTPSFAGMMALVNQKYGRQGQANSVLYPLKKQFPAAFHDVLQGSNTVPCEYAPTVTTNCIAVTGALQVVNSSGVTITEGEIGTGTTADYNAAAGYNLATGLGTIDANQLVTNWGSVKLAATTTAMTPTSTSIAHGATLTINGTVTGSGTPTGNVSLMSDSSEPLNAGQTIFTLNNGAFTGSISTLPGGTYNIWAQYGGDSGNAMSTSAKTQITVGQEASGTNLNIFDGANGAVYTSGSSTTPGSTVDYGTPMILEALVAPSSQLSAAETCTSNCPIYTNPTGTVVFLDGSTTLNTAVLNAEGDAEFNEPFTVGSHSVTASYSGDNSYTKSASSAINFTVVQDTPSINLLTTVTDQNGNALNGPGQPTVFTVQLENGVQSNGTSAVLLVAPPTGTVTMTGLPSGTPTTATLTSGIDNSNGAVVGLASFVVPAGAVSGAYNSVQKYSVTISYPGDTNYTKQSGSGTVNILNLNGGSYAATIAASLSGSISPVSRLTITGTVTGASGVAAPTGSIYLSSDGDPTGYYASGAQLVAGSGNVSSFTLTLNSQTLIPGANFLTLQYWGDKNYLPAALTLNANASVSNPMADFTLEPQTVLLPVTAGNSATDTINLTSQGIPGFSGNVTLSCTAAAGVSCTIPSTAGLSSGGATSAALTVTAPAQTANQTYNVLVTATDPTGNIAHTAQVQAVVSGSSAGASSFALNNSGSITVDAGINTGNTSTVTVTPLGGFTGAVTLTCAVTPAGANSPACSVASPVTLSGTAAQTATVTVTTTSSTAAGIYTVTVTGVSGSITLTSPIAVNVSTPGFTASNSGTVTVAPGSAGTATITLTPTNGFTGAISLSCLVTTSIASPNDMPTCSIPTSATISGSTAQTVTLTMNTTAATAGMTMPTNLFWPAAGGTALALLGFLAVPRRRRNWLLMLGILALALGAAVTGCGGGTGSTGGGGGGSSNPGTTAGNYTVTVTATSGTITQNTAVTLTVN